jgi:hypothetical protein
MTSWSRSPRESLKCLCYQACNIQGRTVQPIRSTSTEAKPLKFRGDSRSATSSTVSTSTSSELGEATSGSLELSSGLLPDPMLVLGQILHCDSMYERINGTPHKLKMTLKQFFLSKVVEVATAPLKELLQGKKWVRLKSNLPHSFTILHLQRNNEGELLFPG